MLDIKIVTHYCVEDTEHIGDYTSVDITDSNGALIQTYGDYYHDKGFHKARGFINGLTYITGEEVAITYVNVNDYEGC